MLRNWRMVRRSSSAWDGCSCHAVAGIEHGQAGCVREQIRRAGIRAAQDDALGAEGLRVMPVSLRDSPFSMLEEWALTSVVSAPRAFAASSNEVRVRVLDS